MTYSLLDVIPGPFDEIGGAVGFLVLVSVFGGFITTLLNRVFDIVDSKMGVKKSKKSSKYEGKNDVERNLETVSRVYDMQSKQAQFQRDKEDYDHKKKERDLDLKSKQDDFDWKRYDREKRFERDQEQKNRKEKESKAKDRELEIANREFFNGYQTGREAEKKNRS